MRSERFRNILDWIGTLALALGLTLTVRTYVAEARWIPSVSMAPTLEIGDRLLVEKISCRIEGINRGDIIVFHAPPAFNEDQILIKRVIGLPGEEVSIKEGTVYINGSPLAEPYVAGPSGADSGPFSVPEDSYFVMGDNRKNSYDSRYWGPVPSGCIIGKAFIRYYPFDRTALLEKPPL